MSPTNQTPFHTFCYTFPDLWNAPISNVKTMATFCYTFLELLKRSDLQCKTNVQLFVSQDRATLEQVPTWGGKNRLFTLALLLFILAFDKSNLLITTLCLLCSEHKPSLSPNPTRYASKKTASAGGSVSCVVYCVLYRKNNNKSAKVLCKVQLEVENVSR